MCQQYAQQPGQALGPWLFTATWGAGGGVVSNSKGCQMPTSGYPERTLKAPRAQCLEGGYLLDTSSRNCVCLGHTSSCRHELTPALRSPGGKATSCLGKPAPSSAAPHGPSATPHAPSEGLVCGCFDFQVSENKIFRRNAVSWQPWETFSFTHGCDRHKWAERVKPRPALQGRQVLQAESLQRQGLMAVGGGGVTTLDVGETPCRNSSIRRIFFSRKSVLWRHRDISRKKPGGSVPMAIPASLDGSMGDTAGRRWRGGPHGRGSRRAALQQGLKEGGVCGWGRHLKGLLGHPCFTSGLQPRPQSL